MNQLCVTLPSIMQASRGEREQGRKEHPCSPAPLPPCKDKR